MSIRTTATLVCAIGMVVGIAQAWADPIQDAIDVAQHDYDALTQTYVNFVTDHYKSLVGDYFSWRMKDFVGVNAGLYTQATQALQSFQESRSEFDIELQKIQTRNVERENASVTMNLDIENADIQLALLKNIASDYGILAKAWQDRCADSTLKYPRGFFDPATSFSPNSLEIKADGIPFSVRVQVSSNFSEMGGGPNVSGAVDSAIATTAAGLAASYLPSMATPISFVAEVGVIIFNSLTIGNEEAQLKAVEDQIYQYQVGVIGDLKSQVAQGGLITKYCNEYLPNQGTGTAVSAAFAQNLYSLTANVSLAQTQLNDLRSKFEQLRESESDSLKMAQEYFKTVSTQYESQANAYIETHVTDVNQQVDQMTNKFAGLLDARNNSKNLFQITSANDQIFDEIVTDDGLYGEQDPTLWLGARQLLTGVVKP
jgi:hypothetical protein